MRIQREERDAPEIPTCSMADIAFLLIVFFMLTTVFKIAGGFQVNLPSAVETRKLPKRNITYLWVSREGIIAIDDNLIPKEFIGPIMARKVEANPDLIVSIVMDKDGLYGDLSDVFEGLREGSAYKVSLATLREDG
ncbi:biopolymer transporter ExbD [candidate division WOR-3 bacterium]|nr:biopolymer transporter ExbD [candidate division WOR-3 bacterium]